MIPALIDGGTVELATGEQIRYLMVDTPELSSDDCFAEEAKEFARAFEAATSSSTTTSSWKIATADLAYVTVDSEEVNSGWSRPATRVLLSAQRQDQSSGSRRRANSPHVVDRCGAPVKVTSQTGNAATMMYLAAALGVAVPSIADAIEYDVHRHRDRRGPLRPPGHRADRRRR
jgi:hypothetical protein